MRINQNKWKKKKSAWKEEEASPFSAEKKKKSGEKSFLENTLANLKDNKLAAIGIGAGAVAFLVKTMGNGPQKTRA